MNPSDVAEALWTNSPSLFPGSTASHSLGWLEHYEQIPDTYASLLGQWNERGARHEETLLIGITGSDSNREILLELCSSHGLTTEGLICDSSRPTTSKTRILSQNHHITRVDVESKKVIDECIELKIFDFFNSVAFSILN